MKSQRRAPRAITRGAEIIQRKPGRLTVECVKGDITAQPDMVAIANAANRQLKGGGGVDGAIHRAAGPELVAASRPLGPIQPGQAVVTPAFGLSNDWVIHCVFGRCIACVRGSTGSLVAGLRESRNPITAVLA